MGNCGGRTATGKYPVMSVVRFKLMTIPAEPLASPSAERPMGSQKPTGACTPSSPASAHNWKLNLLRVWSFEVEMGQLETLDSQNHHARFRSHPASYLRVDRFDSASNQQIGLVWGHLKTLSCGFGRASWLVFAGACFLCHLGHLPLALSGTTLWQNMFTTLHDFYTIITLPAGEPCPRHLSPLEASRA